MALENQKKSQSVKIITLGCPKNVVDSEHLLGQLKSSGFTVSDTNSKTADILIVNTCGFINDAKEESVNAILSAVKHKLDRKAGKVLVMGCLSQRYREELSCEIPEVDFFYGVNQFAELLSDLGADQKKLLYNERFQTTPPHYAYLKISEGCDRACTFCAIPLIRGKHRSIPQEILADEARMLAKSGVKELILVAQDLTWYGLDIYGKRKLHTLIDQLSGINEIEWIRLHYAYPASFPADLLHVMASNPKVCRYLDIPFQHIDSVVLKNMQRGISTHNTYRLISALRNSVPGIAIRTTLMTGFPGETEEAFRRLMRFVETIRFDRLGVFTYSPEDGTPAHKLGDQIPFGIKQSRASQIMELQQQISLEINTSKIGKSVKVLIDKRDGDYWVGRTESDSPEIDNEVLIPGSNTELRPGHFYSIRITSADAFDLYGHADF